MIRVRKWNMRFQNIQNWKLHFLTASTTPLHIVNMLPSELLTQGDIVLQPDPMDPNRKPSANDVVKGYIMLLKTDQAGFITSKDERGANQYAVNFAKLRETMKRRVFEGLIRDKYGVATCRIVRILLEKGKLDETQVTKLAMLPPKDTREKLALLNTKGIVEIQASIANQGKKKSQCADSTVCRKYQDLQTGRLVEPSIFGTCL